jgi:PAS domain S-box-containing protein
MKILNKMIFSFVSIVLVFGIILTFVAYLDSERELKNINSLYEERGVSIAKTIDASIMSDEQLHTDSQIIVDRLMASSLDVAIINIHGKAPDGIKIPGYWRGYWILASSNKSNVHLPSNAVDLAVMNTNNYGLASYNENGKPIIDVIYPLHDPSGKAIAIAEIVFDMSAIQSQMLKKNTNNMQIALILTLLAIIATIFKNKESLDNLEDLVQKRTAELEKAYNSLRKSERGLAEAQKIAHLGNWDWNIVTNELYWSDEVYRIFGYIPQEFGATYDIFLNYVHPDDRDYVDNAVKKALKGTPYGIDHRIILANGEERVVHDEGEVTFDEKNIPVRMKGTVQDITERKQVENALKKSEASLRQFYESGLFGVFYYNLDGSVTEANDKLLEMIGYTREDLKDGRINWIKMTPPEYCPLDQHAITELKSKGVEMPFEKEYIRKDGSRIPIITGAATINEAHNVGMAFVLDITKRKKAEEYLARIEISRKQEIHHRIKNNLQVISSLLDLQAEQFRDRKEIKDSEVLRAFRESQDRVISMALIHEELYKGGEIDTLDFSSYIEELTNNLFLTYKIGNEDISLKMDLAEKLFFDMDTAVPLGIIVNELVSNSLKHAFQGRDKGEIRIKFCREKSVEFESEDYGSTSFTLTVSDNGEGMPEIDLDNLDTLGMQLVISLVDQLDGKLELKRNYGTEFTIWFTVKKNNPASLSYKTGSM